MADWLWYLVPVGAVVCMGLGFGTLAWGVTTMIHRGQEQPPKN